MTRPLKTCFRSLGMRRWLLSHQCASVVKFMCCVMSIASKCCKFGSILFVQKGKRCKGGNRSLVGHCIKHKHLDGAIHVEQGCRTWGLCFGWGSMWKLCIYFLPALAKCRLFCIVGRSPRNVLCMLNWCCIVHPQSISKQFYLLHPAVNGHSEYGSRGMRGSDLSSQGSNPVVVLWVPVALFCFSSLPIGKGGW